MTASPYLDMLDALLRPGSAGLSARFVECQVRFVAGCQQPDGGFCGRKGGSDAYYTDFALRTLTWLAPGHEALGPAAGYVGRRPYPPGSVVECFNGLHARRLLECLAPGGLDDAAGAADRLRLTEWLYAQLLPSGGFGRGADAERISAYHTFLGALCFQMLGVEMPAIDDAAGALAAMERPDGGYAELAGQDVSQTSATAAATAFLLMYDLMSEEDAARPARFLAAMQNADGGLKPHAAVGTGDLLSTFTGLLTLWGLGRLESIDVAAVARFLRATAHSAGGFVSCPRDPSPDVEYTYYGVGTLALLRAWDQAQR
jgi:geranylgeranyl transferase type-2 subunit beta